MRQHLENGGFGKNRKNFSNRKSFNEASVDCFRFLHTGELWLDRPIRVRGGLPPSLMARVLEGPRRTWERICQLALREDVDLVVLSGNLVDGSRASPADLDAVLAGCETLAQNDIAAIWMAGKAEEQGPWPAELALPDTVHVFSGEEVQQRQVRTRKGTIDVLVWPTSYPWEASREAFLPHQPGQFVLGLARCQSLEELPNIIGVSYWALGGPVPRTDSLPSTVAHAAGPPLIRDADDPALPTVTIAEWNINRRIALREVSVAAIRYATVVLLISPETQWAGLSSQLVQELESRRASSDADWLIAIKLQGPVEALIRWKREGLDAQLLEFVQSRYLQEPPYLWPTDVVWDPVDLGPDEWLKETSFRGEFLRQVHAIYENLVIGQTDAVAALAGPISPGQAVDAIVPIWEEILRQAAFEGLEALSHVSASVKGEASACS